MAEKDGSTHLSAPAAEAETSQQEELKQSRQSMGQNKPYLAHSKNDRERALTPIRRDLQTSAAPRGECWIAPFRPSSAGSSEPSSPTWRKSRCLSASSSCSRLWRLGRSDGEFAIFKPETGV